MKQSKCLFVWRLNKISLQSMNSFLNNVVYKETDRQTNTTETTTSFAKEVNKFQYKLSCKMDTDTRLSNAPSFRTLKRIPLLLSGYFRFIVTWLSFHVCLFIHKHTCNPNLKTSSSKKVIRNLLLCQFSYTLPVSVRAIFSFRTVQYDGARRLACSKLNSIAIIVSV